MATTSTPDVQTGAQPGVPTHDQPKTAAPVLTASAIAKVKEIMASQSPIPRDYGCRWSGEAALGSNTPWPSRTAPA